MCDRRAVESCKRKCHLWVEFCQAEVGDRCYWVRRSSVHSGHPRMLSLGMPSMQNRGCSFPRHFSVSCLQPTTLSGEGTSCPRQRAGLLAAYYESGFGPGRCGSVGWELLHKAKSHQFNSQSGNMPGLQVWSPVRVHKRGNQLIFLSHIDVSPPLFSHSFSLARKINTFFCPDQHGSVG